MQHSLHFPFRGALEEVRMHLQERSQRWQTVEKTCGFDIIRNPGLHVLETTLRGVGNTCKISDVIAWLLYTCM